VTFNAAPTASFGRATYFHWRVSELSQGNRERGGREGERVPAEKERRERKAEMTM